MTTQIKRGLRRVVLGAVAMLGLSGIASAYNQTFDFTSTAWQSTNWILNGNASWAYDVALSPTNRLRVTYNGDWVDGTVWLQTQIMPTQSWTISCSGQFSFPKVTGADGMALILQTRGLDALPNTAWFDPNSGTGLGTDYLCFSLDSYQNALDPYTNSVGLFTRLGQQDTDLGDRLEGANFTFNLNASYVAETHVLEYTFQRSGYSDVTVTRTDFDMGLCFLSNQTVYVGFWAGTGTDGENHDALSVTITGSAIPEPGSAVAAAGLVALGVRRLRRRG